MIKFYLFFSGERSHVFGIINSRGHFHGQVQTHNDTLFVEPSHHYFTEGQPFHSILYRLSDVNFDFNHMTCSASKQRQQFKTKIIKLEKDSSNANDFLEEASDENRYVYNAEQSHGRTKRATTIDPTKIVCELYVQADHLYYEKYGSNADTVIEQLSSYVQAVNNIFQPIGKIYWKTIFPELGFLVLYTTPLASNQFGIFWLIILEWQLLFFFSETYVGCTASYFVYIISFGAVYRYNCGRRRVAVAPYPMICCVLLSFNFL